MYVTRGGAGEGVKKFEIFMDVIDVRPLIVNAGENIFSISNLFSSCSSEADAACQRVCAQYEWFETAVKCDSNGNCVGKRKRDVSEVESALPTSLRELVHGKRVERGK